MLRHHPFMVENTQEAFSLCLRAGYIGISWNCFMRCAQSHESHKKLPACIKVNIPSCAHGNIPAVFAAVSLFVSVCPLVECSCARKSCFTEGPCICLHKIQLGLQTAATSSLSALANCMNRGDSLTDDD